MRGALLLGLALLAGCAARAPTQPVVIMVPPATHTSVVGALDVVDATLALPRERQVEELRRWTEELAEADAPADRLRLALLLTLGGDGVRDPARARDLVEGRTWDDSGQETLARLVLALAREQTLRVEERVRASVALERERAQREEAEARLEAIKRLEAEMSGRARESEEER